MDDPKYPVYQLPIKLLPVRTFPELSKFSEIKNYNNLRFLLKFVILRKFLKIHSKSKFKHFLLKFLKISFRGISKVH